MTDFEQMKAQMEALIQAVDGLTSEIRELRKLRLIDKKQQHKELQLHRVRSQVSSSRG